MTKCIRCGYETDHFESWGFEEPFPIHEMCFANAKHIKENLTPLIRIHRLEQRIERLEAQMQGILHGLNMRGYK